MNLKSWIFSVLVLSTVGANAFAGARISSLLKEKSSKSETPASVAETFSGPFPRLVAMSEEYGNRVEYSEPPTSHSSYRIVLMSDTHSKPHLLSMFDDSVKKKDQFVTHENLSFFWEESIRRMPKGDLLIIAGDISGNGKLEEILQFRKFIDQLMSEKKFSHIVFIAGNHELTLDTEYFEKIGHRYQEKPDFASEVRRALLSNLPAGVHYLQDESITIDGYKIYGSPWVLGGSRWAFGRKEAGLAGKWALIPDDTDILVTHMPPHGLGDAMGESHVGSTSLKNRLDEISVKLHVFGHIHDAYGVYSEADSQTISVNAATCNEGNGPVNPPIVIDLPRR